MFKKILLSFAMIFMTAQNVTAATADNDHHHHPKHNMLIYGSEEIFASHVVYKTPHNFQVILNLTLADDVKAAYLRARGAHPDESLYLLLDEMDISKIRGMDTISGTLQRETPSGERETLVTGVTITKDNFKILFFNELPAF
jgi:hypothetical protein